jgi:choline dehydrogenase-like flavoprotein
MQSDTIIAASSFQKSGCEVLVIGSGTSGLTTALELSHLGVEKVLVVDHGNFVGFSHKSRMVEPHPLTVPAASWHSSSRHYAALPGLTSSVGGRSRCWYGVVIPVDTRTLTERWPHSTVNGLLGDGLGSYYATINDLEEWRGESVRCAQSESDETLGKALSAVFPRASLEVVPQAGHCLSTPSGRKWWTYSPLLAWKHKGIRRYRAHPLPTIAYGFQALRLTLRGGRVTGALFQLSDGSRRKIAADVVVLAAGTLENSRLYAQALADEGAMRCVWPGLNDHLEHGFIVPISQSLLKWWSKPERAFLWAHFEPVFGANLFVDIHAGGLPEPILDVWWMAQQVEPFNDSIHFNTGGEIWSGSIRAGLSSSDCRAIAARDEYALEILQALSVHESESKPLRDYRSAIEEALTSRKAIKYLNPLGTADHEAGTVSLGKHLAFGGRAHWSSNFFVTGPASFPPAGAANPTLTILALATQTAAVIAGSV